jgi:hypothetical protein
LSYLEDETMDSFLGSVESALADGNWYAALAVSLILPDICGKLQYPASRSAQRYTRWFDGFVRAKYTRRSGPPGGEEHVFLTGADCYALRCAYLHEGKADITEQRIRAALERFEFAAPRDRWLVHLNQVNQRLQLQVDVFSRDMCDGVREWLQKVPGQDQIVAERLRGLLQVYSLEGGVRI